MAVQEVKLPDIGEGVTEGELVKWLVKVGDTVKADQAVAEVMTDKATVEVPSPIAGVVKELKAKEGAMIPIETTMLLVETDGAGKAAAPEKPKAAPAPAPAAPAAVAAAPAGSSRPAGASASPGYSGSAGLDVYPPAAESRVLATPATRRLAREMNIDINQVKGSGLAGRVTRDDVMVGKGAATARSPMMPAPKPAYVGTPGVAEERIPLRGVRKKIAENLQMAKQIIPHFTLVEEANVDQLVQTRAQAKALAEKAGVKVTYLPFVMKALVSTIREFPAFNASIDDANAEIVMKNYFNIGFAADTPNGLLVPVVKNVENKTILEISREIQELAAKARDGKLALDEMKGATITITNIGSVGGLYATPIINHPEVAILGMYKIMDKPVWTGKEFVRGQFMNFSITCDHRLIDGAVAANFMKAFVQRIENPSALLLDMR
jgi:pyruvate dehydrogenase E2 component (dihydrolipoamide acetyltransferase)